MTEDNQNNEFKPQPLPGQVFIRPGIDDRPDYEKTLTPEAKAAMRRLSVQQHPRIPEASNERPETQAARIASEGGAPLTAAAHLDVAVPNLESSFRKPSAVCRESTASRIWRCSSSQVPS